MLKPLLSWGKKKKKEKRKKEIRPKDPIWIPLKRNYKNVPPPHNSPGPPARLQKIKKCISRSQYSTANRSNCLCLVTLYKNRNATPEISQNPHIFINSKTSPISLKVFIGRKDRHIEAKLFQWKGKKRNVFFYFLRTKKIKRTVNCPITFFFFLV